MYNILENEGEHSMDWLDIAVVTISSVVTGVIVWYVTTALSEKRLQRHLKVSFSELSGHWEGIHLTRDDSRGGIIVSRHDYDLIVSSDGKIKGTCDELSGNPPYKFEIDGAVTRGEIFLMGKRKTTEETSYEWLSNLFSLEKISGFHLGYDFDGKPYASYIVLSRRKLDDKEYFALLEKDLSKFYISPMQKNK
jgi:hypothetical protein